MTPAIAMAIEGVLRRPVGGRSIEQGARLYRTLSKEYNVILISDDEELTPIEDWLELEAIYGYGKLVGRVPSHAGKEAHVVRLHQLIRLTSQGYPVDLVIDPDPRITAFLVFQGYHTMTFTHSSHAMPEWRPDFEGKSPVPWDDLVREANKNARQWTAKQREPEQP